MPRKKKTDAEENTLVQNDQETTEVLPEEEMNETINDTQDNPEVAEQNDVPDEKPVQRTQKRILKINPDDTFHEEQKNEDITWHELQNAYRSKRIVSGMVSGLERNKLAGNVVVVYYKDQRVAIPISEMMINLVDGSKYDDGSIEDRLCRICNTMLGAEIDFVIKGMDTKSRTIVASRKEAMLQKRDKFYLTPAEDGLGLVREGRCAEARVIAVTPLVIRVEVFGVETTIRASDLSWDWVSDVSDTYHVGDQIKLMVTGVTGDNRDNLRITANVKSILENTSKENLSKCTVQGKYIGSVTNIYRGTVYIRLKIGVNAIAHTNYDKRMPGKNDIVSFVVTRIDPEHNSVAGIITRIIKQNI